MSEKIGQFKIKAEDAKNRETDMADTETMFRLIQSIPSPKAEPFKLWLARVGYERVEEVEDPEKAIQRALATYLKKGYSKSWVDLRLKSIEIRKDLKKENLRDNMTKLELVLNMLAETANTEISKEVKPKSFPKNRKVAKRVAV